MSNKTFIAKYVPLLLLAMIGCALLATTHYMTADRYRVSREQRLMQMMSTVLDGKEDGEMIEMTEPSLTGDRGPLNVYRQNDNAAIALYPVMARGYIRPITLLVGFNASNTITGVRVIDQDETPGLGSRVHQDESGWLKQFSGLSLDDMKPGDWAVPADNGIFDALSGATITSRRVIDAIHKSAEIHAIKRETFYSSR